MIFSLVVSTVIFLPSIRIRFGLVEIAVLTIVYSVCFFNSLLPCIKKMVIPMIIYGLMCFLFGMPFQFKLGFLHPIMTLWIWIFPILMCNCLLERDSIKEQSIIIGYNIILLLVIVVATAKVMLLFPNIMRMMTSGATEAALATSMANMNVGGFGIAYGCGAILLTLVALIMNNTMGTIIKLAVLSGIGLCGFIVFKAQFTTLLGLCIIGIALILYLSIDSPILKILSIVVALFLLTATQPLLYFVIEIYQGTKVAEHLQDLYASWFEGEQYHSYRNEYFINGLNLFLKSPLLGVDVTSPENHFTYIASHSTVLGVATRSGIIGCLCYFYSYWLAARDKIYECSSPERMRIYFPLIGYFLALSIMNPTESDVFNYCVGFISLVVVSFIIKQDNDTKETLEE